MLLNMFMRRGSCVGASGLEDGLKLTRPKGLTPTIIDKAYEEIWLAVDQNQAGIRRPAL